MTVANAPAPTPASASHRQGSVPVGVAEWQPFGPAKVRLPSFVLAEPARRAEQGAARTLRLRITEQQAEALHSYIPGYAAAARAAVAEGPLAELVIDMGGVRPAPFYAELVCLCDVLRRACRDAPITISGANPAVAWSLLSCGLPEGVRVAKARHHRRWPALAGLHRRSLGTPRSSGEIGFAEQRGIAGLQLAEQLV